MSILTHKTLHRLFHRLSSAHGCQDWWPGEDPFEVMVGAVLTQATSWANVEKAICNLKKGGVLTPSRIAGLPTEELAALIHPSGYYRQKAARLHSLAAFVLAQGGLSRTLALPTRKLRQGLLAVHGIGPETADSILLYAAERPVFVVDRYTQRILERMGLVDPKRSSYNAIVRLFTQHLPADVGLYKEFHALLVAHAKAYCRALPACRGCPLEGMCKEELNREENSWERVDEHGAH